MDMLCKSQSSGVSPAVLRSSAELFVAEAALAVEKILLSLVLAMGSLSTQTGSLIERPEAIYRILQKSKHESVPENKDDGDSEEEDDDEEDDGDDDQEGDDQEEYGREGDPSGEENDNEDDENDGPQANGEGGSDKDSDEGDEDDDDDDESDEEDEEEDEEEELLQPPTKKRK